ncbi:MAG: aminoglycoside phosphotransferase family protein [Clostridiaceae bacterium]
MDELLFKSREQITRGWSEDAKYQVTLMDGITYFLKISSIDQYDRKKAGFELLQEVATLGIPMSRPIAFGVCSEGVYTLQSWIEGLDGEDIIPLRTASELAALGMEAGQILKKIHSLGAPKSQEDWESRFNRKIDRNISNYLMATE